MRTHNQASTADPPIHTPTLIHTHAHTPTHAQHDNTSVKGVPAVRWICARSSGLTSDAEDAARSVISTPSLTDLADRGHTAGSANEQEPNH